MSVRYFTRLDLNFELQAPEKEGIAHEILNLQHKLKAAKRDHNLLLADSIDCLIPAPGDSSNTSDHTE